MVHREHDHYGIRSTHNHRHHHLHNLHKKQAASLDNTDMSDDVVITPVTTTLSVIQQVGIDSTGATLSVATVLQVSPAAMAPTGLPIVEQPVDTLTVSPTSIPLSVTSPTTSQVGTISDVSITSRPTSSQIASITSSASNTFTGMNSTITSRTTPSLATTNSFILSNSTAISFVLSLTRSSSPLPSAFSLSTFQSTTFATSSPSLSSSQATSIISSQTGPSTTISTGTMSSSAIFGDGTTGTGLASIPPSAATSTAPPVPAVGNVSNTNDGNSSTGAIAGGVVGGVAGVSILALLLFMFLRWKRGSQSQLLLGNGADAQFGRGTPTAPFSRGTQAATAAASTGQMTEHRLFPHVIPAALAALTGHKRKTTQHSLEEPSLGSERGFYRVSGRHITSVLTSGGDGYGDNESPHDEPGRRNTMSGGSFHRDSRGVYGGSNPGAPPPILIGPLAAAIPGSRSHDSVTPVSRQGPARTPVISQSPFADPEADIPHPEATPLRLRDVDGVGRSLVSQDGSHTSRFVEDV